MFQTAINQYLKAYNYSSINLKAVLFDMDGVLFDSMPYHAEAWNKIMADRGINLSKEEAYLHEGRTGADTINLIFKREWGRDATEEEIKTIYEDKCKVFNSNPPAQPIDGVQDLIGKIKRDGLLTMIVTGSGQHSLLDRLNNHFPDTFKRELMVTAFDIKFGKPNPDPYLMALKKGHLKPNEAIIIENAPLGVQAGVSAGIFTIAVNTGPLPDKVLWDAGANLLFPSMRNLNESWNELFKVLKG